ncbi:hypothetical protein KFK09_020598 [Dendrobium nobile]|uniref:Uncharacterized protein n=1 Tax=Dendrobium nobile TaxID=94219 RepID=A0A8T3ATG6_DENNO|nr:hypothetical protein KFK09_020598 [Dendrobium nobile]
MLGSREEKQSSDRAAATGARRRVKAGDGKGSCERSSEQEFGWRLGLPIGAGRERAWFCE